MSEVVMAAIEEEGHEDWLSFADVTAILADERGIDVELPPELVSEAVAIVAAMVRMGRLIPGSLPDRLEPWRMSREDAATRIEREAAELIEVHGDIPLGEVAWFTLPRYVEQLGDGTQSTTGR